MAIKGQNGRRSQAERSAATRARIIEATIECLAEFGYAATSMAAISDAAGVSKGGMQHQFRDKSEIMGAVVRYLHDSNHAALSIPFAGPDTPGKLFEYLKCLWDLFQKKGFRAGIEIRVAMHSDNNLRSALLPIIRDVDSQFYEELVDLLKSTNLDDADSRNWARNILALMRGYGLERAFDFQLPNPEDAIARFWKSLPSK